MVKLRQTLLMQRGGPQLRTAVIEAFSADGWSGDAVIAEVEDALADARDAHDQEGVRVLSNLLDCLIGWCSPEFSLERLALSEEEAPAGTLFDRVAI